MAKKRKKVFKGVRYIATQLKEYYPKRYPNYTSALPRAREIVDTLKLRDLKVTWSNAVKLERKPRIGGKQGDKPYVPSELLTINHYWFLSDYPDLILSSSNKVFFTSDLIPASMDDMQGGELYSYDEYFSYYVNHCNRLNQDKEREDKVYEQDFYVKCTEPTYNRNKKRWESKIISVNVDEDEVDYNFDPNKPNILPNLSFYQQEFQKTEGSKAKEEKVEEKGKKEGVSSADSERIKAETDKIKAETAQIEAKTKLLKEESRANIIKMFMRGDLTKAEYKEEIARLDRNG